MSYDVIIIGAGIAGPALATGFANQNRKVLVLERDLQEPDTFRGELMQPTGLDRLNQLGLEDCVNGIDAVPCYGYNVFNPINRKATVIDHQAIVIKYPAHGSPGGITSGLSFHHGRLVMNLRKAISKNPNVELVEATATNLLEDSDGVIGVGYRTKDDKVFEAKASLTIDCCGSFSKFRKTLTTSQPHYKSHFVALLLENVIPLNPCHGIVVFADPCPVLAYQISTTDFRMLIDVPHPLPSLGNGDLKDYLIQVIHPQLPDFLQGPFLKAVENRIRSVPCQILHSRPKRCPGGFAVGDSLNMRHPLTGGGMTVALNDACIILDLLKSFPNFEDRVAVNKVLDKFFEERLPIASSVNILSVALYEVFCGACTVPKDLSYIQPRCNETLSDTTRKGLDIVRDGCFAYFLLPYLGTSCLGLVSAQNPSPILLLAHFTAVAFYAVLQILYPFPTPKRLIDSLFALYGAAVLIIPLVVKNMLMGIKPATSAFRNDTMFSAISTFFYFNYKYIFLVLITSILGVVFMS